MYYLDRSTHVTVGVKGPRGCVARGAIWQRSTQARQRTDNLERETTVADICGRGSSTRQRIVCGGCVYLFMWDSDAGGAVQFAR
jgi:hypothetical protein